LLKFIVLQAQTIQVLTWSTMEGCLFVGFGQIGRNFYLSKSWKNWNKNLNKSDLLCSRIVRFIKDGNLNLWIGRISQFVDLHYWFYKRFILYDIIRLFVIIKVGSLIGWYFTKSFPKKRRRQDSNLRGQAQQISSLSP
jgi:hypothetical protein